MTERGLPLVDGAPACPFVAFEDDRDERASSPDHRHRCYAEIRPAPRALAHQEAYCLSSAFPVCPTFQDWARREAARARAGAASAAAPQPEEPPRRNPPRDWSAPPPWAAGAPTAGVSGDEDEDVDAPDFLAGRSRTGAGAGLAGSAADRLAGRPTESARIEPDDEDAADEFEDILDDPDEVPDPEPRPIDPRRDRPSPYVPAAAAAAPPTRPQQAAPHGEDEDDWAPAPRDRRYRGDTDRDAGRHDTEDARDHDRGTEERRGFALGGDRRPKVGDTRPRRDDPAPSWERPRRYEAYPTLKTRVGLPAMPQPSRLVLMVAAVGIAALALFFAPALFLNPDDDNGTGVGGSPSPTLPAQPSASVTPTQPPAPTPQLYTVQEGDTLSRIAARFGISLAQLIEANRETHPDPDVVAIGDQLIIPTPVPEEIPASSLDGAQPSAAP